MKIKIIGIVVALFLINSVIAAVGQTHIKNDQKNQAFILDDVPIWGEGDSWTYNIDDFTFDYSESGLGLDFAGEVNDFTWTVDNVEDSTYELGFTGDLNCDYEILVTSSVRTLKLAGAIESKRTKLSGTLIFTKSNLHLKEISGELKGITRAYIGNLPFPLPIPFKVTFQSNITTEFPLFDFPLSNNKFWNLPEMDIKLDILAGGIFHIIKIPITFTTHYSWIPLAFHCTEKQSITVDAGTFDAWEIQSLFFDLFRYYYSPEVKNVIKIDATLDRGSVHGELIDTSTV